MFGAQCGDKRHLARSWGNDGDCSDVGARIGFDRAYKPMGLICVGTRDDNVYDRTIDIGAEVACNMDGNREPPVRRTHFR